MTERTRNDRRKNRKLVLDALVDETGSFGGDAAAARVTAYRADPIGASTIEFGYVGALTLRRFYLDDGKPDATERRSLWQNLMTRMNRLDAVDPGGWDDSTLVMTLQAIAEEA